MLRAFRVPLTWREILKRTAVEVMADNCLGLAAQLAYYFFLALFPALLFLVAVISFMPISGLLDAITAMLARVAPREVLSIVQEQLGKIANDKSTRPADPGHAGNHLEHLVGDDRHRRHAEPGLRHPGEPSVVEGAAAGDRPHHRAGDLHRLLADAGAGRPDARGESRRVGAHGAGVHVDLENPAVAASCSRW